MSKVYAGAVDPPTYSIIFSAESVRADLIYPDSMTALLLGRQLVTQAPTYSSTLRLLPAASLLALVIVCIPVLSKAQSTQAIKEVTATQLIDRLVDVNDDGLDMAAHYESIGKTHALDSAEYATRWRNAIGKPLEAINELVRRGVASLPELIHHLSDTRKSRIIANGPMGTEFYAELDSNPHVEGSLPKDVDVWGQGVDRSNQIFGDTRNRDYAVCVGDICFTLIGRIVNRWYEAVRGVPEGVTIINSPILWPPLAKAVESRWSHLTVEKHRKLLISDIAHPDRDDRDMLGLFTLNRYYPDAVPQAVRERLILPMYDFRVVAGFADEKLYLAPDLATGQHMIDDFVKSRGTAYLDGLLKQLWKDKELKAGGVDDDGKTVNISPLALLAPLVGHIDPKNPPLIDSNEINETGEFVQHLSNLKSPAVDAVVFDEFKRASGRRSDLWGEEDWIAAACVRELMHKGHDTELKAFCVRRGKECTAESFGPVETHDLLALFGP